ncbi:hypothetical protein V8D89_004563 [Ganoderma adspersum]
MPQNGQITFYTNAIPAITYGGPEHPPGFPSADATVLIESMVIVEFLAEIFPSANLLPRDPVLRAKARIFVSVVDTKVLDSFRGFFFMGAPANELFAGFEAVQALLPPAGGFAVGAWSIADIAAGPYLVRMLMLLEHEIGKYSVGEGKKTLEALRGPRFARVMKYVEDVKAWPSFRATWDEVQPKQLEKLMLSALSAIQRVWNTTCPIHRLPTEVLVHIFSLVPERRPVSKNIPERNHWPFTFPAVDIHIQLGKVCKHWQLQSPHPQHGPLARCPRGPLHVHIDGKVSPRMWSLLKGEGHRIQQLHMTYVTADGEAMLTLLQTFPANQLEHCKIDISMPEDNGDRLLSLFSGGGRSLRSLYLCRVTFLPSNVFPRLSCLILDLPYHHKNPYWDIGDLSDFLAGSPGLEHLHLSQVCRIIATALSMILSVIALPRGCEIQLKLIPLNELQAISLSLLSLGRPFTRMRLALGEGLYDHTGTPKWDWSLVLASLKPDCGAIRLSLEPAQVSQIPTLLGANFSKLPLFVDVEELWYSSGQLSEGSLRRVLLPPRVRGLALNISASGWVPGRTANCLAQVVRVGVQLDTLCICVQSVEHLRDVRKALTSLSAGPGPDGKPRCGGIRRVAVGYDRGSLRLSRGAISLKDCGAGTEVSWTGPIARRSGEETEMERLLTAVPQVLEEPASIRAAWPVWPEFLRY